MVIALQPNTLIAACFKQCRIYISIFLILVVLPCQSQNDIHNYVLQNVVTLNNLNPDSTNYTDLEAIGKSIGDARVVLLGEQDHGDAPTFLAKARIIKFLHEKMGFDVLVFESDFWALSQYWDSIPVNGFAIDSIRRNTYGIWSQCIQAQPVYDYINTAYHSQNPLIVAGMDCRHARPLSKLAYVQRFNKEVLQKSSFKNQYETVNRFNSILKNVISKEYRSNVKKPDRRFFYAMLDTLIKHPPALDPFWVQELRSLRAACNNVWRINFLYVPPVRDIQMADNLNWLYHVKYPGKKIIVWAHSGHIARNLGDGRDKFFRYNETLGTEIYNVLKDTVYGLGFACYTGTAGRLGTRKYELGIPKGDCFENWVHSKDLDYGFVSFKNYKGNDKFRMAGSDHWLLNLHWANIFDGMVYIKNMYACHQVDP